MKTMNINAEPKATPIMEEKLWGEIKTYEVATNNARRLGILEELVINEKSGKIVDIVVQTENDKNVRIKGARKEGNMLYIPFAKVEKVGEFIIVAE
ncbi:PRC-barrel domain-containing protein [Methanobrevibacter filiformis]|uniref:PRC-barrel domain protein n=1 Tax=Methanobrevibacter filiformis TaxID=55758 RepID=A0A166A7A5_9EURY|nr:PRC-barrel domain-containing protein [Methanobrevibacter filiformis]KZX11661.1 PRC-barrel domain protein [Methanobrevibacter filiformis]